MSDSLGEELDGRFLRRMTVARVREPPGAGHAEVMFYESARIYRLPRANRMFEVLLRQLREAAQSGRQLEVAFASPESDVIEGL